MAVEVKHFPLYSKIVLPAAGALAALAVGGYALSRGGETNPQTLPIPQTQGQGVDVPPVTGGGEPSPKEPEVQVIIPPSPPEQPPPPPVEKKEKPIGNGAIMPAELSTTGVFVDFEYQGQTYKLALYNLPDRTPITAPKDGYFVARKENKPFIGSGLSVFNPTDLNVPHIQLIGSLNVGNKLSRNVKRGEVIGTIQNTGEKMFEDYNFGVIITSQNSTGKGFFSPDGPYQEYLPDLPKGSKITQTQPIQSSSGNVYISK